jgi:hypothetical protein
VAVPQPATPAASETPSQPQATDTAPADTPPADMRVVRLPAAGGAPVKVSLASATRVVRLDVAVADDRPSFDAVVRTADGREVWRSEGIVPASARARLAVKVPARLLSSGRYTLRIEGESLRGTRTNVPFVLEYSLHVIHDR